MSTDRQAAGSAPVQNSFGNLSSEGLAPGPRDAASPGPVRNRGRVDILRERAHRGGKTVTVIANFTGVGLQERQALAKALQKACGTGGTLKDGRIELQGDQREAAARLLAEAGFRPVFAGG